MIEAGLGGRYDATNVIALEGPGADERRPRAHALARPDACATSRARSSPSCATARTLVIGADLQPEAQEEARAGRRAPWRARSCTAPADPGVAVAAPGAFQRRNFALARAAAEALPAASWIDGARARRRGGACSVPGRLQVVDARAADRRSTARTTRRACAALADVAAASCAPGAGSSRVVSVLDDKDAAGMLRALLPHCEHVVFTRNANPRALPPATLASLCAQLGDGAAVRARGGPAAPRCAARASWPAPAAPCWRPARSTSSPTCCAPAGQRSASMLVIARTPRRTALPADDRARGGSSWRS